jgi:phosphatidylinositol alpha-1,6-mannosyltransferase
MPIARRPRALFLTTDYPPDPGGLQSYSRRISTGLRPGLLAHVAVGSDRPGQAHPPPSGGASLSVHRGRDRWRALAWSFGRILPMALSRRIDVILHMQWSTAVPSWLLRVAGIGPPYVVLIHGAELLDPGRPLLNRVKAAVFARASAVVAGSRATAALFQSQGLPARRLEVIHYGNPLEGSSPEVTPGEGGPAPTGPAGPVRLLCMHRLVPRKGTGLLLDALAGLSRLPWSLEVVGRGEEEAFLRRKAGSLGLADRVSFLAPVDEEAKRDLIRHADLFILPSLPPDGNNHVEGLGLGLLEAQSQGLPVLAARTGGIPEAVDEGRTGLLFDPGDAADLSAKLELLLRDAALRARLGAAGPAWVAERFDWGRSLERLSELLEEAAVRRTSLRPS